MDSSVISGLIGGLVAVLLVLLQLKRRAKSLQMES